MGIPIENSNFTGGLHARSLSNPTFGGNSNYLDPLFNYGSSLSNVPDTMAMYIYGPLAMNRRMFGAYQQQMMQCGYDFENYSITKEDQINLQPLSKKIDEFRIGKIRVHTGRLVTDTLKAARDSGMGVGLYLTNCAQDGVKNPYDLITFDNLKNPERMVNTLKDLSVIAPNANKNIGILSDIAIKERSPELAAILLEATSKGDLTVFGTDSKTAKKLIIDSRKKFSNDGEYHKFITNIEIAYKRLYPDKQLDLDTYIKKNYKPAWQKAMPLGGIAAGAMIGSKISPLLGAIAGGIAGIALYTRTWFGRNKEGSELLAAVDHSRNNSHYLNMAQNCQGQLSMPII